MSDEPRDNSIFKPKRSPDQKRADYAFFSEMRLQGLTFREMHEAFLALGRPYTLSLPMVKVDMKAVRRIWLEETVESQDERIAQEVEALRMRERELWRAWNKSKLTAVRHREEEKTGTAGDGKKVVASEEQYGDPAIMRLLLEVIVLRCKLLGINPPDRLSAEITGEGGGAIKTVATAIPFDVLSPKQQEEMLDRWQAAKKGAGA